MERLAGDPNQYDPASFPDGLQGKCLCGSIRVTIKDPELFSRKRSYICHCANCRKASGSFASINLIIGEEKVHIEDRDGTLNEFLDQNTVSGTPLRRWFCSHCGSPIRSVTPILKGMFIIKMGIFPQIPAPAYETFALHKHPWECKHADIPQYKLQADGETL